MSSEIVFGIDIGGTSTKIGLAAADGTLLRHTKLTPTCQRTPNILFEEIASSMRDLLNGTTNPKGIGICAPGYPDPLSGVLIDGSGNVPALKEASLTRYLTETFGLPTAIGNDGVCAALGELKHGTNEHADTFVFVTLGTGIGGAIVWNGQILQGPNGEPPEFGAIVVRPGEGPERHGSKGYVEHVAGARAMLGRYEALSDGKSVKGGIEKLFELKSQGDLRAAQVIDDMFDAVAQMLGTIINTTGIQACVLGGGLSSAGQTLLDGITSNLGKYTWPMLRQKCRISLARCGSHAGMIGAAELFWQAQADNDITQTRSTLPKIGGHSHLNDPLEIK